MTAPSSQVPRFSTSRSGSPTGGCVEGANSPILPRPVYRRSVSAYARAGRNEQGCSLDTQRDAILRFATEHDLLIVSVFSDGDADATGRTV